MSKVFAYLDHIFRMVRPRRLLYMAIDGVAPRAKMNQQRSRRFRSALEAQKAREEAARKGEPEPSGEPFDSNCITPGTPFMARLSEHLRFYVLKKQTEDPLWQRTTVILSGHEVRGEGEHKIMEHIRWARGEPGWDPNQTHCLYGLDADLIMLALVTHEPHFCLLREVVKFGGGERGQPSREVLSNPTDDGFLLLHVGLLREYLDQEFRAIADALPFEYDCERVIDDFVLLSMLVGNDFLPPLPTLDIAEGALNTLFATYRELLPTLGGYVSGDDGGGTFNPARLEKILAVMGEKEADVLAERSRDAQANEDRKARKASGGRGFGGHGNGRGRSGKKTSKSELDADEKFRAAMASLAAGADGETADPADGALEPETSPDADNDGISKDPTMMSAAKRAMFEEGGAGIGGWKEMYYREKLGLKVGQAPPLAELRQAYFEGLSWVLQYYYRGVASWTWYYPFHYAPMASDLSAGLGKLTAKFEYGVPFRPFEQLLAVQPPQSAALLPEPFRWLMNAPHSPLAPFFPSELKVDFEGKRNDWEGVVLLPFLDEALLKQCIASVPAEKLTEAQIRRNRPGPLIVFQHNPDGAKDVPSTLPKVFGGLFPCKSRAFESMPPGEFPESRRCFGGARSLLDGVKLGVDRPPGFPTMHTLTVRGQLKNAGVNVFGTATKKESLILRVGKGGDVALRAGGDGSDGAAGLAHLLGRRVHVGWPYLREAMVVAVSDKSEKIVGRGVRTSHGSSEWSAETQRAANELLATRGVDVQGQVSVALHCRQCEGLVRHPDGSLQKRFGKTESLLPAQLALAADPSPSPRLTERPAADADADDLGGFSAGDVALYLGRSHFGAVATVANGVAGKGLECLVDPVPPCTGVGRRILQGVAGGRYEAPYALAKKLGLSPRGLSVLTGPLWVAPTKDAGRFDRVDLGLNLKSAAKGLCVADYTRPGRDGNGWEYSQNAAKLMQEYKSKHGWVFNAINADPDSGFEGLELETALKHLSEEQRLAQLKATKAWLKATPAARKPLVSKFSKVAAEEAVKALCAALGDAASGKKKPAPPVSLESVSPLLLMRPVTAGEVLDLYAGGDFDLGDRVVMVGDGGSPPFGTRGYVVAVHGEAAEVMFDRDFVGATDLHGVLPDRRGAMLPTAQLVNLSHPPAMPQLGSAAPDRVVADKKGKITKGGWDGKDGKGGGRGVLAMAAALLPGRAGAPPAAAQAPPAGPKMPVAGSKGFAGAMGRGRGAGAAAGNLRALGKKPMPGAIVGSVPLTGVGVPGVGVPGAANDADALKGLLGIGGAAASAPAAPPQSVSATTMSLEDLERRMAGMSAPSDASPKPAGKRDKRKESRANGGANGGAPATPPIAAPPAKPPPSENDPAAFWTALAGGAPPPPPARSPAPAVSMPPAVKKTQKVVPPPNAKPSTSAPMTLAELEAATNVVPATTATATATATANDDPLAFWAELQAQHRSEADAIIGISPEETGGGKKSQKRRGAKR